LHPQSVLPQTDVWQDLCGLDGDKLLRNQVDHFHNRINIWQAASKEEWIAGGEGTKQRLFHSAVPALTHYSDRTYGSIEKYDKEGSFSLVYMSFANDLSLFSGCKDDRFHEVCKLLAASFPLLILVCSQKEELFEALEGQLSSHQDLLKDREKALVTAKTQLINDGQKVIGDRDLK